MNDIFIVDLYVVKLITYFFIGLLLCYYFYVQIEAILCLV